MAASTEKKRRADLPDDIVLHIIKRLPMKYAARCGILSKYFYNTISTPKFVIDHHLSSSSSNNNNSSSSIIFHHADSKFTRINSPKSVTLPTEPANPLTILDSCNGLLLLYHISSGYYVFNPFTSGVMMLKYPASWMDAASLIVEDIDPSSSNFDFKLVELHPSKKSGEDERTLLYFGVHVPRRKKSKAKMVRSKMVQSTLLCKKNVFLSCRRSFEYVNQRERERRPVYIHGCVHWLEVGSTAIAAFDVESGTAGIMDGPVTHAVDGRTWFGSAQGSLQFIRTDHTTTNNDVVFIVHTHNYVTREWRVAHKIQMMTPELPPVVPVFFDGKNVLFHKSVGNVVDILEHDLSMGEWRKSGQVDQLIEFPGDSEIIGKGHHYLEYVPTRATASAVYLSKMPAKLRSTQIGTSLLQLQHLLLD